VAINPWHFIDTGPLKIVSNLQRGFSMQHKSNQSLAANLDSAFKSCSQTNKVRKDKRMFKSSLAAQLWFFLPALKSCLKNPV
jgi:hypothetical protein